MRPLLCPEEHDGTTPGEGAAAQRQQASLLESRLGALWNVCGVDEAECEREVWDVNRQAGSVGRLRK